MKSHHSATIQSIAKLVFKLQLNEFESVFSSQLIHIRRSCNPSNKVAKKSLQKRFLPSLSIYHSLACMYLNLENIHIGTYNVIIWLFLPQIHVIYCQKTECSKSSYFMQNCNFWNMSFMLMRCLVSYIYFYNIIEMSRVFEKFIHWENYPCNYAKTLQ